MILLYILIFLSLIRLFYWIYFFQKFSQFNATPKDSSEAVSIIVCAKNEYENLKQLIPLLLSQSYAHIEIIIVDDYSSDETFLLKTQFTSINWITPSSNVEGKKNALTDGIQFAHHPWVLLTDADCLPTFDWVKTMLEHKGDHDVLLGFSPMVKSEGLINLFSRYETLWTALQYMAYALRGLPYMGVGRNLLYRKSLFKKVNGFEKHKNILSGDDDLFIQSVIPFAKVGICLDPNSWVMTKSMKSLKAFLNQKLRHTSTSFEYQTKHKVLLGVFGVSHMLWILLSVICLFICTKWTLIIAALTWLIMSVLHYKGFKKLGGNYFLLTFTIMDVLMGIYYWTISIFAPLRSSTKIKTWS